MPLNYSKWAKLEVSDDSDIEGHPNVDHKSLVRWKQRDIHEKRDQRKRRIAQMEAELAVNDLILPRLAKVADEVAEKGPAHFSATVERLKTDPSPEKPNTTSPNQPTYDEMLNSSLMKVWDELKAKGVDKDDPRLGDKLVKGIREHIAEFRAHHEELKQKIDAEQAEQKKKITSDDIHEGFDSKYVPAKPAPAPLRKTEKVVEYEVLNPDANPSISTKRTKGASGDDADDEEEELPEMTPDLKKFAQLKVKDYEGIYRFIQQHRSVVVPGASDALLIEAFNAETTTGGGGDREYARQCVHQSLVLQYCEKLGKDGVRVFFQRMMAADPRAEQVFAKDFEETYAHMSKRAEIVKAEEEANAKEQIQLVAADVNHTITFNVPDGPPPKDLRLEGPGTEDLDVEEVRVMLQMRWEVFHGFPEDLQKALANNSLEEVNVVLGKMSVPDAEDVVQKLQMAGILSFADEGRIRDASDSQPKAP